MKNGSAIKWAEFSLMINKSNSSDMKKNKKVTLFLKKRLGERKIVFHASPFEFKHFERQYWNKGIANYNDSKQVFPKVFMFTQSMRGAIKASSEIRNDKIFIYEISIPKILLKESAPEHDFYDGNLALEIMIQYDRHIEIIKRLTINEANEICYG